MKTAIVKRKDYCQFLLASQVNYTLTYFVDHARGFSHDAATRYLRVTGLGLLNYGGRTLTTPSQPTQAISSGLETLLANAGLSLGNLKNATIIHGTTLITNALITRSGKSPALITTKGAGDSIETGKGNRYDPYDRMLERPLEKVMQDLEGGIISVEHARAVYGVKVNSEGHPESALSSVRRLELKQGSFREVGNRSLQ